MCGGSCRTVRKGWLISPGFRKLGALEMGCKMSPSHGWFVGLALNRIGLCKSGAYHMCHGQKMVYEALSSHHDE
jgi:hypothetical protein